MRLKYRKKKPRPVRRPRNYFKRTAYADLLYSGKRTDSNRIIRMQKEPDD